MLQNLFKNIKWYLCPLRTDLGDIIANICYHCMEIIIAINPHHFPSDSI